MRLDAYQLRNLSALRKLLESFGLLLFGAIFVLTWILSVRLAGQGYTREAIALYWGNVLTDIRMESQHQFMLLFAGNLGSMIALFLISQRLFLLDAKSGQPLPPLGQVAFQQGPLAAHNIIALLRGQKPRPFRYFNFGSLVSVGEHFAAVDLLGVRLSGFVGWLVWRTLYLVKVVGLSNRIRILLDWTLDLLIERSFTQIQGRSREVGEETPAAPSGARPEK